MAEDRSDLDSVFGSEDNETHKYETNGKRIQTNRNKKSTRSSKRDTLRYSSESPTGRVNKYPPLSATKSETATLRPVTASASVMYGLPEVQDYVPRPVTTSEVTGDKLYLTTFSKLKLYRFCNLLAGLAKERLKKSQKR